MNKAELVSHVAAETSTTTAAAERMVDAVFSAIHSALARDESVAIAGFGKFAVRNRSAHQGRNLRTGQPVAVPASKVQSFKPAKALRYAVSDQHNGAGGHMLPIRFDNAATARTCRRNADLQTSLLASCRRQMPEQWWAALFAAAAPAIPAIVVLPPKVSKVIARRIESMLLHKAPDPNRSQTPLIERVESGTAWASCYLTPCVN